MKGLRKVLLFATITQRVEPASLFLCCTFSKCNNRQLLRPDLAFITGRDYTWDERRKRGCRFFPLWREVRRDGAGADTL
jgi:hypothetical protein